MMIKSIQKVSQEEKEVKLLIASLKNVLSDVPYDFMYDDDEDDDNEDDDNDEYYDRFSLIKDDFGHFKERMHMANKKFPQDCTKDCPHFHTWDMSVDDWTCVCDLLKVQIDEFDMDYQFMFCPQNSET